MTRSVISPHYEYRNKPLLRLNPLQLENKRQLVEKLRDGTYMMEECVCLCGSDQYDAIAEQDRFGLPVRNVLCRDCGLIRVNPRMTDHACREFYNHEYRSLFTGKNCFDNFEKIFSAQYETGQYFYKFLREYIFDGSMDRTRKVLEVGCSYGGILAYFRDQGHDVLGLDYDDNYLSLGRSKKNLNLRNGSLEALDPLDGPFDLVIMSHMFEHLNHPDIFLNRLRPYLDDQGLILIQVPGLKWDGYYRKFPFDLVYYFQIAHPFIYTLNTLCSVLFRAGFCLYKGTEDVLAVFRTGTPSTVELGFINEYHQNLKYIRRIEFKRPLRLAEYYLFDFWVMLLKRIVKKLIRRE